MGEPAREPPPGFDDLPIEEQIEYIEFLWNRIAAHPVRVPVPEWHKAILEQRLADLADNPDDASPWEEVEARLRAGLSKKE